MNYQIGLSVFGCAMPMANGRLRALQGRRWIKSEMPIAIGSMNIFMAIRARASGHRIKLVGLASLQNSSSNKASTVQSQSPIHSQIYRFKALAAG
jgi:hypothetical protein